MATRKTKQAATTATKAAQAPKAKASTAKKKATPAPTAKAEIKPLGDEELCVFAFRLPRSERDEIHAAAGSGKASAFVRRVALAAARGDEKALRELASK